MNGALHLRADVDILYVTWGKGGRGWMSVGHVVRSGEHSLLDYLKRAEAKFRLALGCVCNKREPELITEQKKMRLDRWHDKLQHGQYQSRTGEKSVSCWKLPTEYIIRDRKFNHGSQDQTLVTKAYRVTILKQQSFKKWRMFNENDKTAMHILSECSKPA